MRYSQISSAQNSRLKLIQHLREKRARERERMFVVDSIRDTIRALQQNYTLQFALISADITPAKATALSIVDPNNVFEVSSDLLAKVGYRENPDGIVAVFRTPRRLGVSDLPSACERTLILDRLEKPGNIGALLRSADGSGFSIIILSDVKLDLYNPNIIRASTGAVFLQNIYELSQQEAIEYCQQQKIQILAADPEATQELYQTDLSAPQIAVVLGTEDQGLSADWKTNAKYTVRIPMIGRITDSLNVSVSGALMMYEVLRQQRLSPSTATSILPL